MQSLHVMDADFTLVREIAEYKSLRMRRAWHGSGEFELHASGKYAPILTRERILFPPGEPHKAMIIEAAKIEADEVTASGTMLSGLLRRRICVPGVTSDDTYGYDRIVGAAETVLKHYVDVNCVHTESAARKMGQMIIEVDAGRGMPNVPWSARFEALSDVCEQIGAYAECGYAIIPDFAQKKFVFTYLPGRDRVDGVQRVTFSAAFGNVSATAYTEDARSSANVCYIGGAGEDEQRAILSSGTANDLARREMWAEAGSISDPDELRYEAEHRLAGRETTQSISAEVIAAGATRYGADWDVGDRVSVEAGGKRMYTRITQVEESHEHGRPIGLSVTFGEPPRGIADAIRTAGKKEGIR